MNFDQLLKNNQTIAVTGHNGFIGAVLTEQLVKSKARIIKLFGDVRDPRTFKQDFNILFHLAAALPSKFPTYDPLNSDAYKVNVIGTHNALQSCKKQNAHLIFTSTSGVYSPTLNKNLSEEAKKDPQSPYAISKYHAEQLCEDCSNAHGIKVSVLRLFNIYGLNQSTGLVLSYLIECAKLGRTAEIRSPNSGRDFLHVDDAVEALLMLLKVEQNVYDIFNIGAGRSTRIQELITMISQFLDHPFDVIYGDEEETSSWADISKFQKRTSWKPARSLEIEVRKLLAAD